MWPKMIEIQSSMCKTFIRDQSLYKGGDIRVEQRKKPVSSVLSWTHRIGRLYLCFDQSIDMEHLVRVCSWLGSSLQLRETLKEPRAVAASPSLKGALGSVSTT